MAASFQVDEARRRSNLGPPGRFAPPHRRERWRGACGVRRFSGAFCELDPSKAALKRTLQTLREFVAVKYSRDGVGSARALASRA